MILYFADRGFNILGMATTKLQTEYRLISDVLTDTLETGTTTFECEIAFTDDKRIEIEKLTEAGNYLLRYDGERQDFFTIIEPEIRTAAHTVSIYAENVGMDLLNEVVGAYASASAQSIVAYVTRFLGDSGFTVGINEIPTLTRRLVWEGEDTVLNRLQSAATQFGCEISYSFDIQGLTVRGKYINIYKHRGESADVQLRMNDDISDIRIHKSVAEVATALKPIGANDINLSGYVYDDGDYYVSGGIVYSRAALNKWKRWDSGTGNIIQIYQSEATTKASLCSETVAKLGKLSQTSVTYEADIIKWDSDVHIGDTLYIVDDNAELYLQGRVQQLKTYSLTRKKEATLGDFVVQASGINDEWSNKMSQWMFNNLYTISIDSTLGTIYKDTNIDTTVMAHVFKGTVELTTDDISAMDAVVNWYNGDALLGSGLQCNITSSEGQLDITAKLEVN